MKTAKGITVDPGDAFSMLSCVNSSLKNLGSDRFDTHIPFREGRPRHSGAVPSLPL